MMKLTFWYTLFAIVATLANIGSQDITIRLYQGHFDITLSILVGTAVGLLVKYVLDHCCPINFTRVATAFAEAIFSVQEDPRGAGSASRGVQTS